MKVFEGFAGYGGASFALKKAGIDHEVVGYSEIDKYAIQCYNQNHFNKHEVENNVEVGIKNFGDITKIDPESIPDFDLFTGGFPCQSFSVAGKGKGEQDTRGTLFHDIIRICEVKKPSWIVLENVKGLTFKPHKATFKKILSELSRIGYYVYWKVLNSKEHGIPQNRERVFIIGFRTVKELNKWKGFPEKEELKIFLKDILEKEVDEKYFLSDEQTSKLLSNIKEKKGFPRLQKNISGTILSRDYKDPKCIQVNNPTHSNNRVYSDEGVSPTLNTMNGGNRQPFILDLYNKKVKTDGVSICLTEPHHNNLRIAVPVLTPDRLNKRQNGRRFKEDGDPSFTITAQDRYGVLLVKNATKKGYLEGYPGDGINLEQPNSRTRRGRIQKDVMSTLQTNDQRGVITRDFRIRKLTPKECFRLMGFLDDEIKTDGLSNTQKYKLAGNGWEINLVSKIFKEIFQIQGEKKS